MRHCVSLLVSVMFVACANRVATVGPIDSSQDVSDVDGQRRDDSWGGMRDASPVQHDAAVKGEVGMSVDRPRQAIVVRDDLVFNGIVPTTPPPRDPAVAVRRGSDGGCLLTRAGAVWCWEGRLPRFEGLAVSGTPIRVSGLPAIRRFAGDGPWAGIDEAGGVWVWSAPSGGRSLTCDGWVPYPHQTTQVDFPESVRWADGWLWITEGGAVRRSHPEWTGMMCEGHPEYWRGGVTSAASGFAGSPYCVTTDRGTVECLDEVGNDRSRASLRWLFQTRPIGPTATELEGISDAASVHLATRHQCVLQRSGRVLCWGYVEYDFAQPESCEFPWEPSSGEALCLRRPTAVPGIDDAVMIDLEESQTCALRRSGEVWCWGVDDGVLGLDGSSRDPLRPHCGARCTTRPERVVGLRDVVDFSISGFVPTGWCAVLRNGRVYCRGACVGDGTCDTHLAPVEVRWE